MGKVGFSKGNLVVVSGGYLEELNGEYFGMAGIIKYFHEISEYFDQTFFFTHEIGKKDIFSFQLDLHKVTPVISRYPAKSPSRISKLLGLIRDQIQFFKILNKTTTVIVFYPSTWVMAMFPVILLKRSKYYAYLAIDPEECVRMRMNKRGPLNHILGWVLKLTQNLTVWTADGIIARGKSTFEQAQKYRKPILETRPLIYLTRADFFVRQDTCQKDRIRLLYVGWLLERKGVDVLIRALAVLQKKPNRSKPLELIIAGSGPEEKTCRAIAQAEGIESLIQWVGWVGEQSKLLDYYRESDMLVLPSLTAEGFPRVIDEAMASSLPVVATRISSLPKELKNEQEALLVEPGNPEAFAVGIQRIIEDDNLRQQIISQGRERAQRVISEHSAAKQHAEWILKQRSF